MHAQIIRRSPRIRTGNESLDRCEALAAAAQRAPMLSPFALAFGSFDAFAAWSDEQVADGVLDLRDFPIIVRRLWR